MDSRTKLGDLAREVLHGLQSRPKRLACRFFYDVEGSRLFEKICGLPEYYVTRAEDEILARHAAEIVALVPDCVEVIELGSGSALKTRRLLSALLARSEELRYVPIDISKSALESSARDLRAQFPALRVGPVLGEYGAIQRVLDESEATSRLVLWLGSNVGNLDRRAAASFLRDVRAHLLPDDRLVIGIDRRKSRAILERAYDDGAGVTARFNRNLLARINAELGGRFDPSTFEHVALYDEDEGRIEMHLESTRDQIVRIEALGLDVVFEEGERVHTEDSYKYSDAEIRELARASKMRIEQCFHDDAGFFAVCALAPA